ALLTSESLAGLEELLLTYHPMDTRDFDFLAANFALPSLRRLGLEGVVRIDHAKARALAHAGALDGVQVLALRRGDVSPEARGILAERFGEGLLLNERNPGEADWKPAF